jgi:hypothetical protein
MELDEDMSDGEELDDDDEHAGEESPQFCILSPGARTNHLPSL